MSAGFSTVCEFEALAGFLDQQRDALVRKVDGLSDADARRAPTVSALSLLSLLKHCAIWEERWFQGVVAGRPLADGWPDTHRANGVDEFHLADDDTVLRWLTRFEAAVQTSREIVRSRGLDAPCERADIVDGNVRWVVLHMIEETARHAGHADIIRETLDGSRGM
jgi:uncharacterized damage-inducible protein DinB